MLILSRCSCKGNLHFLNILIVVGNQKEKNEVWVSKCEYFFLCTWVNFLCHIMHNETTSSCQLNEHETWWWPLFMMIARNLGKWCTQEYHTEKWQWIGYGHWVNPKLAWLGSGNVTCQVKSMLWMMHLLSHPYDEVTESTRNGVKAFQMIFHCQIKEDKVKGYEQTSFRSHNSCNCQSKEFDCDWKVFSHVMIVQ